MTSNNNISVLPFYTNIDEQNHRKSYAYGEIYPLFSQAGMLLPFQIQRAHRNNAISQVRLYRKDGTLVGTLTQAMTEAGLSPTESVVRAVTARAHSVKPQKS